MKRLSLLLIGLCWLLFNSQAQTVTYLEYFFDTDPGVLGGTQVEITGGDTMDENLAISVTGLTPGFHYLYFRVFYDDFSVSISQGRRFYVFETDEAPSPASDLTGLEYYFDTDPGPGNGISEDFVNGATVDHDFTVDVSGLNAGFHYLYIRTRDADFKWSIAHQRKFYVFDVQTPADPSGDLISIEYFFDTDPGPGNATSIQLATSGGSADENFSIPVDGLESGFHQLGIRILDADNKWSIAHERKFYVFEVPPLPSLSQNVEKIEYFFGTDPGIGNGVLALDNLNSSSIDEDLIIDVDGLDPGMYTLSVRVIDAEGKASMLVSRQIEVQDNNTPDVEASIFSVDENSVNTTVIGSVSATDADGNDISYAFTEANSVFAIDETSGEIIVLDGSQLDYETIASYTVTVEVTDTNAGVGSNDITINISDVNEVPNMANIEFILAENSANATLVGTMTAEDPENDDLSFSITAGNESGAFDSNATTGEITVLDMSALDFETNPVFTLTVVVSDGTLTDEASVTINLSDVFENNAPIVANPLSDRSFMDGFTTSTVNLTNVFSDVDNHTLVFSVSSDDTNVVTASVSGVTLTITEVGEGSAAISVTADDTFGGQVSDDFVVLVYPPNVAPLLGLIADQTVEEDEPLTFAINVTDADVPTQTITYQLDVISNGKGMSVDASGNFSWTPSNSQTGVHNVLLTISDGIEEDNQSFKISVNEINDAPVLSAIGPKSVVQDIELTFLVEATDVDVPAQQLTFSLDANSISKGMAIDAQSGAFSWTPESTDVRVHDVTVSVTDGKEVDSQGFTIVVIRANVVPTVANAIATVNLFEGFVQHTVNLANLFSDADGDLLVYSVSLDVESSITATINGSILGITEVAQGTTTVTITVIDGYGGEADFSFNVIVEEAPLSVDGKLDEVLRIYPNPSTGHFSLEMEAGEFEQLIIYSLDGKAVKHFDKFEREFDIKDLKSGIYSVVIQKSEGSISTKLSVSE